jgi:branched-chain amino acid transport system substrate-binding protein
MATDMRKTGLEKLGHRPPAIFVFILAVVFLLGISPMGSEAGQKVIRVGGTLPLSGPASADGQRFLDGRKLAVEKINEDGGVLGAKLELIIHDDGMEPARVTSLYENLVRKEKLDILVDSYGAAMVVPAMTVAQKYDKLVVSAYSGSTSLVEKWGGRNFFSAVNQPKSKAGVNWWYRGLTNFLWDFDSWNYKSGFPKPTKIAILNEDQLWGVEQHKLWKPYAEAQGWNIVLDEFVGWGQLEFSSIISKIKTLKPDVIFVEFYYFRCIQFAKQLREQGVQANFVVMSESGTRPDWTDANTGAGKLGNGIFTFAYLPKTYHGGGADELRKRMQEKYDRPPGFLDAAGYAQIQLIAEAIKRAGSTKTDEVRAALVGGEFKTCLTPVRFDAMGNNELWDPLVGQWIDDELENVYPVSMQTKKPIYPYTVK